MPRRSLARSPLQRALYPVLGGIGFFVLLGLATWGVAALLSGNPEDLSGDLSSPTFEVGHVESIASIIADEGPLIFPDLVRTGGVRTVVLDHTGDDPRTKWTVYYAAPADRSIDCKVTQQQGTRAQGPLRPNAVSSKPTRVTSTFVLFHACHVGGTGCA